MALRCEVPARPLSVRVSSTTYPFLQPLSTVDSHNTTTPAHQGITPCQPSDKDLRTIHDRHPSTQYSGDIDHQTRNREKSSVSYSAEDGIAVRSTRMAPVSQGFLPPPPPPPPLPLACPPNGAKASLVDHG